jgi:hypothetical protein
MGLPALGKRWLSCHSAIGRSIAFALIVFVCDGLTRAEGSSPVLRLHTEETYVDDVLVRTVFPKNPALMFAKVFSSLPNRVHVYPTENYYYFYFFSDGVRYAGNLRLGAVDRDQGKLHFSYYEDGSPWHEAGHVVHTVFDRSNGVSIRKVAFLKYVVQFRTKSIVFVLNDLSDRRPPEGILNADEVFIGPIFDESAISFFLIFNKSLKQFLYVLDEMNLPERLVHVPTSKRILIGERTGFAFYEDSKVQRKILIGVFAENADVNNYFDGPFDQLPDNFIRGTEFRDFILLAAPELEGKIDRFGIYGDGERRYAILPYLFYRAIPDLNVFAECAENPQVPSALYYNCFVIDDDSRDTKPTPLALKP